MYFDLISIYIKCFISLSKNQQTAESSFSNVILLWVFWIVCDIKVKLFSQWSNMSAWFVCKEQWAAISTSVKRRWSVQVFPESSELNAAERFTSSFTTNESTQTDDELLTRQRLYGGSLVSRSVSLRSTTSQHKPPAESSTCVEM